MKLLLGEKDTLSVIRKLMVNQTSSIVDRRVWDWGGCSGVIRATTESLIRSISMFVTQCSVVVSMATRTRWGK